MDKKVSIYPPYAVLEVLIELRQRGFNSYIVGGCVRDSLLDKTPKDWDVCTDALPDDVITCFLEAGDNIKHYEVIETGLKHGTVTILVRHVVLGDQFDMAIEVTTFRVDGMYSDNRHPDSVSFTNRLDEDLARRDFTINAMAFGVFEGEDLIDPFEGIDDLEKHLIRCVGDPDERFKEDGLRILRAIRFAAVYGFTIDLNTELAIKRNAALLKNISAERIQAELCKTLMANPEDGNLERLLDNFSDIITIIIPEFIKCLGFNQNNKYHDYDVYTHILKAVSNYKGDDLSVKLTLFLHDIGKPDSYTCVDGAGHFYGHAEVSRKIADEILHRLRFDNNTITEVTELIAYHDVNMEQSFRSIRRLLRKIGAKRLDQLIEVRRADILAQKKSTAPGRITKMDNIRKIYDALIASEACFKLKDLAISGKDIIALGIPEGKIIGEILDKVLDQVVDEKIQNTVEDCTEAAKGIIDKVYKN